jgi:hypothetical protein
LEWHSALRGFSFISRSRAVVARQVHNLKVRGSSPLSATIDARTGINP